MIVKNEGKRYLDKVLNSLKGHIDEAVIIDDGSTDNTIQICKEIIKGIPLHIIQNEQSMFANEVELRKKHGGDRKSEESSAHSEPLIST
jgi:glycosyltransferase involved in cell wall biosynthesis